MPVPARGGGRAREGASREAEMNPRARRSLLEGALDWATPVGRGGPPRRGPCLACALLSERCFVLVLCRF
jgi:hypothetical protein